MASAIEAILSCYVLESRHRGWTGSRTAAARVPFQRCRIVWKGNFGWHLPRNDPTHIELSWNRAFRSLDDDLIPSGDVGLRRPWHWQRTVECNFGCERKG